MELPDDILDIIRKYYQPISRPDWRQGCYFKRNMKNKSFQDYIKNAMSYAVRYQGIFVSIWGEDFMYQASTPEPWVAIQ